MAVLAHFLWHGYVLQKDGIVLLADFGTVIQPAVVLLHVGAEVQKKHNRHHRIGATQVIQHNQLALVLAGLQIGEGSGEDAKVSAALPLQLRAVGAPGPDEDRVKVDDEEAQQEEVDHHFDEFEVHGHSGGQQEGRLVDFRRVWLRRLQQRELLVEDEVSAAGTTQGAAQVVFQVLVGEAGGVAVQQRVFIFGREDVHRFQLCVVERAIFVGFGLELHTSIMANLCYKIDYVYAMCS